MAGLTTSEKKEAFLKAFNNNACNISASCEAADIDRSTFYVWVNKFPKFDQAVKDVQEKLFDFVENKIMEKLQKGDRTMLIHYSKTKMKGRGYVEKQILEHEGPIPTKAYVNISPDDWDEKKKEKGDDKNG